jgi:hypothetical protein
MVSQEEVLKREITQLKELKAFNELDGEYNFCEMIDEEKKVVVDKEFILKYGNMSEEQIETQIERLEQDLQDLQVQNGTLFTSDDDE